MSATESMVLCEGYHDRAFWTGWLLHLRCVDPGAPLRGQARARVVDPWDTEVERGDYAFDAPRGGFIRVRPCGGKDEVCRAARIRLGQRATKPLAALLVSVDADRNADRTPNRQRTLSPEAVGKIVREADPGAAEDAGVLVMGGGTKVHLLRWEAGDPPSPALPNQQTLERLVCAALLAAYPHRGEAVSRWLESRPKAPEAGPKEHAWSHMAGWYAEHGCQDFYRCLWDDPRVAAELRSRLEACGAWQVVAALTGAE